MEYTLDYSQVIQARQVDKGDRVIVLQDGQPVMGEVLSTSAYQDDQDDTKIRLALDAGPEQGDRTVFLDYTSAVIQLLTAEDF